MNIRHATIGDAVTIAALVHELASQSGESSPVTAEYVPQYLGRAGSHVLLAEEDGQAVGLLSYTVGPNLYHGGDTAVIEELVVTAAARGRGIGGALLQEAIRLTEAAGCMEVSVSTMPDNEGAIRFYRAHGLVDEALLLEKHFGH